MTHNDDRNDYFRTGAENQEHLPVISPDIKEAKYWNWLSDEYAEKLDRIRHAVRKLIADCESMFPQLAGYTPHGPEHFERVENIIHRLIPGDKVEKLKMRERFYLLASAWIHDVGMLRGLFGDEEHDRLKYSDDRIRREHHKRSEIFIVNHFSRLDIDYNDSPALALLAHYHRRAEDLNRCPMEFPVNNDTVALRLLAAYLRLADSLDIDQSRSPASDYAICIAYNIPIESKLHWIKSRLVSGIAIEPEAHKIIIHFKEPHRPSLLKELQKANLTDKDIAIVIQNLARLRKMVIDDLLEELNSVKNFLIRGGISYFLDVEERSTRMAIDNQVFREIVLLANNFDMITHPSASGLMEIVLNTVERIVSRHLFRDKDHMHPSPSIDGNPEDAEVKCGDTTEFNGRQQDKNTKKQGPREKCHTSESSKFDGANGDGRHISIYCNHKYSAFRNQYQEFLDELECEVMVNRPCHIGLRKIVKRLKNLLYEDSLDAIQNAIKKEKKRIHKERAEIRKRAHDYFAEYIATKMPFVESSSRKNTPTNSSREQLEEYLLSCLYNLIKDDLSGESKNGVDPGNARKNKLGINVLVYGYSELVIKSLCGFRDYIVRIILNQASKKILENHPIKIHKINFEQLASDFFTIYVCEGQPKTMTAPNDALAYHDGSRYAVALARRGFTRVVLIPDLVTANLLHRSKHSQIPPIHLVLLGANGLELLQDNKVGGDKANGYFRHSSGHMAIAALARNLKLIKENIYSPRLVLVLTTSKCLIRTGNANDKNNPDADSHSGRRYEVITEKDGYIYFAIDDKENTRNQPFLVRDEEVRSQLYNNNIKIYNPREDCVPINMVDDVILEFEYRMDVSKDESLTGLINTLENKIEQ
ncbi:hypothetical protein SAMN02745206_03722 [Desulfacinum infernum DSM 9756]|uniref:HD-CE domain-containing protein n=1 Tax=Desulfacinum infernum DSM 9756 TaxID=1121391 RepID=A0A1M5J356_9BACT|nr:hypothetical protein [Desulfacinum infernum]SHG34994.1 hypothetical protein SAMN02745206_03722 [Desulfacinum infernum DSM 9756]